MHQASQTQADTAIPDSLRQSRRMIHVALWLAITGTLFGLTYGVHIGAVAGLELWLLTASLLFCSTMLLVMRLRPFDENLWVAPVVCLFFYGYLVAGGLVALLQFHSLANLLVYLLWFFPLLAFNRFVNTSALQYPMSLLLPVSAVLLALLSIPWLGLPPAFAAPMVVYALAMVTFVVILSLLARYREAYIQSQEQTRAMAATHRAIEASEHRYRQMFDRAASGMGWLTLDGQCQHTNATFGEIIGTSPSALQGRPFASLVVPAEQHRWHTILHDAQQPGQTTAQAELQLTGADGNFVWVRISLGCLYDDQGAPRSLVFVCLDVTQARHNEQHLQQSQRLEAVGRLTGGIAHDFNNLLTVILGNAELLTETLEQDPENQSIARLITEAGQKGADLTRHLLAFSRRQPLQPRVLDVNRMVRGMIPLLRRTLGDPIEIRQLLDDQLWAIKADQTQLEAALLNLCINARDAMPRGGVLTISTTRIHTSGQKEPPSKKGSGFHAGHPHPPEDTRPDGDYVLLTVTDTGHGIAPQHMGRIFEPFYTTKPRDKGTGLGLAMTYGFVKQSGGQIAVHSQVGAGTSFRLYLPAETGVADRG